MGSGEPCKPQRPSNRVVMSTGARRMQSFGKCTFTTSCNFLLRSMCLCLQVSNTTALASSALYTVRLQHVTVVQVEFCLEVVDMHLSVAISRIRCL